MREAQYQDMQIEGATTYTGASATAKVALKNLQPIAKVRGKRSWSYLRSLLIALTPVLDKSDAGNITLEESHSYNVIDRVYLHVPGWAEPVIDLSSQAGAALHAFQHAVEGKRAHGAGDTTVTGSTQTTYYRFLRIPFSFPGSKNPDDGNIPIALLKNATLEIQWADGSAASLYASTTSIHSTAAISRVTAEVVERDEFVVPVRYSIRATTLASAEENLPFAGRTLRALIEVPEHTATGLTDDTITNAERTLVTLSGDGLRVLDRIDAADLCEIWNRAHAKTRDDELAAHKGTAAPFVPIYMPPTRPYSATQLPHFSAEPKLEVTGSDTTAKLIYMVSRPITPNEVAAAARAGGIRLPRGNPRKFMKVKTPEGLRRWGARQRASQLPVRVMGAA